jgi:hypothetical protein
VGLPADTSESRNGVEVWAGYSPTSTNLGELGRHSHLSLGLVGVRFNHRLSTSESRVVDFTFDVIPYAHVAPLVRFDVPQNSTDGSEATLDSAGVGTVVTPSECRLEGFACRREGSAMGAGITPLGVTVVRSHSHGVQLRYGLNGGLLIFEHPTPSDLATRFNFTASAEVGIQIMRKQGSGFLLVYRMHHLSNAGRGNDNLALLSHVFSAGFRWR